MGYKCIKCGTELDIDPINEKIICPKCSGRIILKQRPETKKEIKAR